MPHLIDGQIVNDRNAAEIISGLRGRILETLSGPPLTSDAVINAADDLAR